MTDPRIDTVLEAALSRVQLAVSGAVDKVSTQLGVLTLSATSNVQRQVLMSAERDLQLKSAQLLGSFNTTFRAQATKAVQGDKPAERQAPLETDWASLSLVDNAEVERGVMADRLAQVLAHECADGLDALYAFVAALLDDARVERNPLRPQAVASALLTALGEIGCADDVMQALVQHTGRVLGPELAQCYQQIVGDMRTRGVKPQGLSVNKSRAGHSSHGAMGLTGPGSVSGGLPGATMPGGFPDSLGGRGTGQAVPSGHMPPSGHSGHMSAEAHLRAAQALSEMFGVSMPGVPLDGPVPMGLRDGPRSPGTLPPASADFQNLLREIARQTPAPSWSAASGVTQTQTSEASGLPSGLGAPQGDMGQGLSGPLMAMNLIRAHREELVRASGGAPLDQMVIDIVAALFDQVLSDPKVSPQMARQIARLQMPVLRVALGDMGFFNSRKHPVRRFVNRIASLSASFDDHEAGPGQDCLARITALVNDIVDGDFDRMALYEAKLAELESFISEENERDAAENAAVAALLSGKEADLRVQQRYMQILKRELSDVEMPAFVRDFLAQIWSQVQVMACARDGAQSPLAERMKKAGNELVLSVQPKGHPQLRKAFLLKLPQLMKDLNEGLALIQWPEEAKQAFFAQLLPAHAEGLKAAPHHDLTQRMLEQRLSKVEQIAIPSREDAANDALPASLEHAQDGPLLTVVSALSSAEIKEAGFVPEAAVSDAPLDIDLGAAGDTDPALGEIDINLDAPAPPAAGPQLVHHIQKGTAYQMMMQEQWKKVRLTWISEGRSFFIFTHGHTHKQTISLTARTLAKMCETRRFKAFEQAELIERATVRARRQLAALGARSAA